MDLSRLSYGVRRMVCRSCRVLRWWYGPGWTAMWPRKDKQVRKEIMMSIRTYLTLPILLFTHPSHHIPSLFVPPIFLCFPLSSLSLRVCIGGLCTFQQLRLSGAHPGIRSHHVLVFTLWKVYPSPLSFPPVTHPLPRFLPLVPLSSSSLLR